MSKKGGITSWIVTLVVMLLFILIFFIFFFMLNSQRDQIKNEIKTNVLDNQININLLNFLRTQVTEKENVADYIGYAMLEDKENKNQKAPSYEVPPENFNQVFDLFNKYMVTYYTPQCAMLNLELIDTSGIILTRRNIGFCDVQEYFSSIIVPIKETGELVNVTMITGTRKGGMNMKFCLSQRVSEWYCSPYYESTGLGGMSCDSGLILTDLVKCQEEAKKANEEGKERSDVAEDVLSHEGEEKKWILYENSGSGTDYDTCECEENYPTAEKVLLSVVQIFDTKKECDAYAMELLRTDLNENAAIPRCYNYYGQI
jgi:hypothetical protein